MKIMTQTLSFIICLFASLLILGAAVAFAETAAAPGAIKRVPVSETHYPNAKVIEPTGLEYEPRKRSNLSPEEALNTWEAEPEIARKSLDITVGTSRVIRFQRMVQRIAVSNIDVVDVVMVKPDEILINSKKKGSANLIIWDLESEIMIYSVNVESDATPLETVLRSIDPQNPVEVYPTQKGFVVKGTAETVNKQNQIASTAKAFAEDSVSLVTVDKSKQVLLEIRFIEIDRSNGMDFGIDGHYIAEKVGFTFLGGNTGASLAGDGVTSGLLASPKSGFGFPALDHSEANTLFTGGFTDDSNHLRTFFKALESKNLLKIIARPNLLVRDGEEADFLVGGEFPVPVVTDNTVNITFKEFGTQMKYRPEILKDDLIRLNIDTEVSQLDFANGVQTTGFLIPALASRRASTVVELKSGFTLIIGGLIQQRISEIESGTPFLRRIPFFGRLFESTENEFSEVELLVTITPRLIDDTDVINLNDASRHQTLRTALRMEEPPFEDEMGVALEESLIRNVKDETDSRSEEREFLLEDYRIKRLEESQKKSRKRSKAIEEHQTKVIHLSNNKKVSS